MKKNQGEKGGRVWPGLCFGKRRTAEIGQPNQDEIRRENDKQFDLLVAAEQRVRRQQEGQMEEETNFLRLQGP